MIVHNCAHVRRRGGCWSTRSVIISVAVQTNIASQNFSARTMSLVVCVGLFVRTQHGVAATFVSCVRMAGLQVVG